MLKRIFNYRLIIVIFLSSLNLNVNAQTQEIDLSGEWGFQTDVMDFRRGSLSPRYNHELQEKITLPGITDDYKIGYKSPYSHIDRLTRVYEYMGPAWYQREITIPKEWKGKRIFMYFERTHWLSSIYVDTKEVSKIDYISVPHNHDLTDFVTPGKTHLITVCIDNRYQYNTHKWNHAHTEFTQINWNGILGEMKLMALDPVYVDDLQVYPDIASKSVKVKMQVNNYTKGQIEGKALFTITQKGKEIEKEISVSGKDSCTYIEDVISLGEGIALWDEFSPNLYTIKCSLNTKNEKKNFKHEKSADFGMREVQQGKNHVMLNNRPIHLRGNVENAVFPKTGYAPVDDAPWERIMLLMKDYGLNHMRFHSWCPPRAAFRMADKHGIYLEVEMPMWGKDAEPDEARYNFFRREQKAILKEYGNHPSFILYCNGNEITGNFDFIEELTASGSKYDNRHLYSGSTARTRVKSDQYYVSQQTNKGPVKVYEGLPNTDWDRSMESDVDVPVISHESGQRCVYPNFEEIKNYTGPVQARNFEVFRELLDENGMLDQANDFFLASGALTVVEYKAVIEALLRSSKSAGFQLLSINDFPGQGYAPVGILDPFWNSKGLVTPEKWREFCAPIVPLLRYSKSVYYDDETFEAKAEIYNFSNSELKKGKVSWSLTDTSGKVLRSGKLKTQNIQNDGVFPLGEFSFSLNKIASPQKLTVHLSVNGNIKNSWNIWVYPRNNGLMTSTDEVLYTTTYDDKAKEYLAQGKKVVLCPLPAKVKGRKSTFHNHFWNPIMFAWHPKTIGCLIHNDEPMFADFITSYHTDWQWWDILENAKVIEMKDAPDKLRPFIQVIDSYDNNEKLGIGFEAKVNGGKLLVLAVDTKKDIENRPATKQLLKSIDDYVKGNKFDPEVVVDESFIQSFLTK
ncbi:sugar-binding domain-containing protein [Dysgonomonas sp. 520]|uniref:sugar-binding domain-containing protein n=1 Tax=Dysgonomonas sp. 520 TaxID=2302931 RepID=UPI0013D52081|nr:sugar-binding domain-containing protein [Dysgonomonas sp. 520]NDW10720.1 beta-glucuronidase [Dysgonomonas sp. 520]